MHFITDVQEGESPILDHTSAADLVIQDLDGNELMRVPTNQPWTHQRLIALYPLLEQSVGSQLYTGAQAHIGDTWVGSSEV